MAQKHISVIAKPTHECNLKCKYCYLEKSAEDGKMPEGLMIQAIEKVSDFAGDSHWIWHGGEPLLMGVDFYKVIKDVQDFYRKRGKKFSNGIQSNATLVTPELVDFVKKSRDFHVGTSIDGPEEIHNRTRIYSDGRGSFEDVLAGQKLLRGKRTGGGAICVVNAQNVDFSRELYDFFKFQEINVKFNPLIKSGRAVENLGDLGITSKQYGKFLLRLWNVYNEDVKKDGRVGIEIDPFLEVIGNLGTDRPLGCNYTVSCRDNFISIGPQGDIYPCGRFDGIREFWMGNVKKGTIEEAVSSQVNKELKERSLSSVSGCTNCDFGKVCNSGCMHNAYFSGDVFGKDPYCLSYQMLFKEMKNVLDTETELKGGCQK